MSNDLSLVYDSTSPTVEVTSTSSGTINTTFDITVTFSEDVVGFVEGNLSVTNGTISGFTEQTASTVYTATITASAQGDVTVEVGAAEVADAAGNNNEASNQLVITFDSAGFDSGLHANIDCLISIPMRVPVKPNSPSGSLSLKTHHAVTSPIR